MLKIRTKIIVVSTVLYSFVFSIIAYFAIKDTLDYFEKIYKARTEHYINSIMSEITKNKYNLDSVDYKMIDKLISESSEKITYRIFDSKNNVLTPYIKFFENEEVNEALVDNESEKIYSPNKEDHYYCFFRKIPLNDNNYLTLAVSITAREMHSEATKHRAFFLMIFPVMIVIITIVSFYVSKMAFQPVRIIINTMRSITSTNLHRRIEVTVPRDELRDLAESLNEMIARLENSFESQKRFIADASHEIKTPLTIIRAKLEMLLENQNSDEIKEEIKTMMDEVDRLTSLSKSLLTLARLDAEIKSDDFKMIRLDDIIMETIQVYNKSAGSKNIELSFNIKDQKEIKGDETKLKSVFGNILENAIKYSPENTKINIILDMVNEKSVVITIEDQGYGITDKDKQNIFKRFYRSDEHRANIAGSGLGLSIADEIIRQHKGTITFESKVNSGTKFNIYLPV